LEILDKEDVYLHFEDVYTESDKEYVDPLYYIFRGKYNDIEKLIIIIQFKTYHMGVWSGDIERNNLIEGETIYIIKNNNNSTRLMTFICSEAMNVSNYLTTEVKDRILWNDMPFLILHPQINPDPSYQNFVDFRRFILAAEKKEIISLNWGTDTLFKNRNWYEGRGKTARSGIFFKTNELNTTKDRLINNQNKGLYFLYINRSTYVYYLDGQPELFYLKNPPVHINDGEPAQRRREGPEIIKIYTFDKDTEEYLEFDLEKDKYLSKLDSRGFKNNFILNPEVSFIEKERLLNISIGNVNIKDGSKWYDVTLLSSFNLRESDECNNRLTYIEDSYSVSEEIRNSYCDKIFELDANILNQKESYPHCIKHLSDKKLSLAFAENSHENEYRYNVVNQSYEIERATICYLGRFPPIDQVNRVYDGLQKLFDKEVPGRNTVVVFYKQGDKILHKSNTDAGNITDFPESYSSILR
ncbi:hypothetical protein, partial [Acinetobacter radioresistens]|uniref:hypothetical protein n=1 Tax=Acinetobacter radioresistens TaxID=40216 RepID=UPI00224668DF